MSRATTAAGARATLAIIALIVIAVSVLQLERLRGGIERSDVTIGVTPATLWQRPGSDGPRVVVAHGFAGSRQLMQAYSLTLARAGYRVLAYDLLGHGRNPVPMSGDVTAVDGTTGLLVAELRRVIAAARALPGEEPGVALLGHSMATDVIVRTAEAERAAGTPIDAVVAISMFSPAITPTEPTRLLAVSGEWEGGLRAAALEALRQVDVDASEGDTARAPGVQRRAVVAPNVEHVGVLYSATALRETRAWLDDTYGRSSDGKVARPGLWILALLGAIVALFHPLVSLLHGATSAPLPIAPRRFWIAVVTPMVLAPAIAVALPTAFLPVLVADYLAVHLAVFGLLQLAVLAPWRQERLAGRPGLVVLAVTLLCVWGIGLFGVAMDRYAASFLPVSERLPIIAALCLGTLPFMVADAWVSGVGRGRWWQRLVARFAFVLSLGIAAAIRPADLGFLLIVLPVLLLFFGVHGLMGRWIARRVGALPAGLGLGLILAWAIGVSFPLFASG